MAKDRASPHCISWTYRKKRHRKYFRTRIDAFSFRNQKEMELGVKDREAVENEVIFMVLSEINDKLSGLDQRISKMEESFLDQQESMREIRKPPAPKILKITEAAKVLRISRRKLYYLLDKKGIQLEAKDFAMGVRIEHPQELINSIQYHSPIPNPILPTASYSLVTQSKDRGVFSFCMCPGGIIVPSATGPNQVVVNGMSNADRSSPFANSGIVVSVKQEDKVKVSGRLQDVGTVVCVKEGWNNAS